jgi:hypothetical protein
MGTRIGNHIRSNVVGYIAIFLFAMSGTAIALDGSNTVFSDDIVDGEVKTADLGNNSVRTSKIATGQVQSIDIGREQVQSVDVKDETLTGADILNQSVTGAEIDYQSANLTTGTGNAASCNDDDGTGSACVSTTVNMGGIGPITIHATGTWDTFKFNDLAGANAASDNPNIVQGKCNLRFDGIQVGPVQELGEADVSGTGTPTHPAGSEGTVALTARTIPLGGSGTHTLDLFCRETDGDIDFHNLDITAQGSMG